MDDIETLLTFDAQDVPSVDVAIDMIEHRNAAIQRLQRVLQQATAERDAERAEAAELGEVVDSLQDDLLKAQETIASLRAALEVARNETAAYEESEIAARHVATEAREELGQVMMRLASVNAIMHGSNERAARDAVLIASLRAALIEVSRFAATAHRSPTDPTE